MRFCTSYNCQTLNYILELSPVLFWFQVYFLYFFLFFTLIMMNQFVCPEQPLKLITLHNFTMTIVDDVHLFWNGFCRVFVVTCYHYCCHTCIPAALYCWLWFWSGQVLYTENPQKSETVPFDRFDLPNSISLMHLTICCTTNQLISNRNSS